MGLKFGKAVTMIVERYGWSAFDNLSAINDPDLGKAVEMVRNVRKKKDDIHANKTDADLRRARPPREKIEKMVDKGMTYAEIERQSAPLPKRQARSSGSMVCQKDTGLRMACTISSNQIPISS